MSYWITPDTRTFMSRGYLPEGQSVEDRIKVIAKKSEELLQGKWEGFAEKLEEYLLKGWLSLSSPIWSNFGTDRGLPISCNGSYVGDSVLSILSKQAEIGMMSKYGSGTSLFMGALRKREVKFLLVELLMVQSTTSLFMRLRSAQSHRIM